MRALLWALLLLLPCGGSAEIYKWVDENGTVHFEDRKPSQARNIPFQDWDIEASPTARAEYEALQVPLILVGDSVMSGFSEAHFNQLYGR